MISIAIRPLQSSDTEIIDFIKDWMSLNWELAKEEVENQYILPSLVGGFPYIFIALTEDGKFAGEIFLCLDKKGFLNIDNQLWLNSLFVPKKFRGQGIARQLIEVAEEKARGLGFKELYLDTVQASGYYHKLGSWKEIGTDIWLGKPTTIMVKKI